MSLSLKTIAITVTYNPDFTILKNQLESLKSQCRSIIVDNGSEKNLLDPIKEYIGHNDNVKLIALDKNIGISCAQNIGIENVIQHNPEVQFVLLLDHDSIPNDKMVNALEDDFELLYQSGKNPAAIGPLLFDPRDKKYIGFPVKKWGLWRQRIPPKNKPMECHGINSSGSLISINALKKIGLLEMGFFMDHGETEWCFRAIAKGYKIFGSARTTMDHLMGEEVCNYWFLGRKRMPYRTPIRHYYIVRNSLLMQKRPYVPFTWKFWNIVKIFFTYIYFGFFTSASSEHRHYILKGISDGFKGTKGEACY